MKHFYLLKLVAKTELFYSPFGEKVFLSLLSSALLLLLTHKQVSSSSAPPILYSACCFSSEIEDKVQFALSADADTFLEVNCV